MLQVILSNELTKQTERRHGIPPGLLCKLCKLQQNAHIMDTTENTEIGSIIGPHVALLQYLTHIHYPA